MYRVSIEPPDNFAAFREAARGLLAAEVLPEPAVWHEGPASDLFGASAAPSSTQSIALPAGCFELAKDAICHRDPERFALIYGLLWRVTHGERALLMVASDPLVHRLRQIQKSVRRDTHKMTAFVRFRRVEKEGSEHYIAWFEPEHYILRHVASFFVDRFTSMRWSILTPEGSLHWDGATLTEGPPTTRNEAPSEDTLEDWWRGYYRSTFNPARANPDLMRAEMPKKYWNNLPEAVLIPEMLAQAERHTEAMIHAEPLAPRKAKDWTPQQMPPPPAGSLAALKAEVSARRRCPLWKPATQSVFGEGPADGAVVFVGEQPGDQEDLAGRPFVGPAGQMFDRALKEAGLERSRVYVTNAVKHFKYEPRGKRRIHQKPNNGEIDKCRWWVEQELALIKPRLVVAMGTTAVRSLTGRTVTISRERRRIMPFPGGRAGFITVHPSYLLRLPDETAKQREYERFVADMRLIAGHIPSIRKAA